MSLIFEWNPAKAAANLAKHDVSFEEAASAFADALSLTIPDPEHSAGERRFVLLGASFRGRLLVVVHSEDQGTIRVISARLATRTERRDNEESR